MQADFVQPTVPMERGSLFDRLFGSDAGEKLVPCSGVWLWCGCGVARKSGTGVAVTILGKKGQEGGSMRKDCLCVISMEGNQIENPGLDPNLLGLQ